MTAGASDRRARPGRPGLCRRIAAAISRSGCCSASGLRRSLYDPAFATLGRIFGAAARRRSRCSRSPAASPRRWAGRRRIFLWHRSAGAAPIWSMPRCSRWSARRCTPSLLPRSRAAAPPPLEPTAQAARAAAVARARLPAGRHRVRQLTPSCRPGSAAHLLAMFGRAGIDAATVVLIGALFGPSQVARAAYRVHLRPQPASAQRGALRGARCWSRRSRCWRCSAFRCRSPPRSRSCSAPPTA